MPEPAPLASVRGFPTPLGPLDLDVRAGEVVRLRGPNGSGKTSLLRQLAGLAAPLRARSVHVHGTDPRAAVAARNARAVRAAWASPSATLVGLTVAGEARLRGLPVPAALAAWGDRPVTRLSQGQAQAAALAFVGAAPAPLLLLDEPGSPLDDDGVAALRALVAQGAARGAVVFADASPALAGLATRDVVLALEDATMPAPLPPPAAGARLQAPPHEARVGDAWLRLPAVDVGPGLHAVTGRNGSGKSTLLRRLAGLGAEGVRVDGKPPVPGTTTRLLQEEAWALATAETVRNELAGAEPGGLVPPAILDRHPLALSAGEAQRVALAKALRPARVHLLDEPEAHLDADGRRRLMQAIAARVAAGACVVVATHDRALAGAAVSRIQVGA